MPSHASGFPSYPALYAAIERACTDAAFLDRLVHNPAQALAEAGVEVPADADLRIHQPRPGRLLLTLPPMLAADCGEVDTLPDDPALRPMAEAMLRAAREPAFREDLRVAPVATLRGQGVVLAPGMTVDVIDAEPGRIDIIIPEVIPEPAPAGRASFAGRLARTAMSDDPDLPGDMLDDDDLDGVAGGTRPEARAGSASLRSGAGGEAIVVTGGAGMVGASALLTLGGMVAFGIQRHGRAG